MARAIPENDLSEEELAKLVTEDEKQDEKQDIKDEVEEDVKYTVEDLEGALNDKEDWVPQSRLKEVIEKQKRFEEESRRYADEVRQMREEAERLKKEREAPVEKKRDFAAELASLKEAYGKDEMDLSEYLEKREEIVQERAELRAMEKIQPTVEALRKQSEYLLQKELGEALDAEARKHYKKYPFLDASSDQKNEEAIAMVLKERDSLINSGVDPVKALRLAVNEVAPGFVEDEEDADDDVAKDELARRRKIAQDAALKLGEQQPPKIAKTGAGSKETQGKIVLGRSVEDHEKWSKLSPEERSKIVIGN